MPRRRTPLAFVALLLVPLLLLATQARAQLISSTLPACAKTCAILQQAQGSCEANPAAAQTCFCQSTLLAPINTAPTSNICAPACSTGDWATIAAWYKSTCANGGTNAGGTLNTVTVTSTAGTNTATAAAAATTTAAAASSGSDVNQDQTGPEWWNTHWKWIVMLLVLLVAFTAIGVGGRIWYRRHHRKVDGEIEDTPQQAPARQPDMGMWAPSRHSVHDFTNGPGTRERPESTIAPLPTRHHTGGKGKQREELRPPMPARTPSQRLKKAMDRVQM